ncbi:MAG TPA: phage tail tape measure protein, partial [Cytophagaceae bacterium]
MLNALGLGIILTMRDYASMPAGRVQRALLGLDNTARQFSYRFIESMYHVREGMNMMASGIVTLLAPMGILRSSFATYEKLQHVISQGLENVNVILEESLKLSNEFADITRANFMEAAYWIRSGLYWLSDEDVAKFTRNALIVAKATRASAEEMAQLFVTGYGIFKDLYKEMSDAEFIDMFAGGLTEAVRAFNTEGHQMVLAFNDLNADASAVLYNLEEQLAALGLLQQTMPGHRAGTRLRAFVQGAVEAAMEFNYPIVDAEGHLMSIADLIDRLKKDFKDIANVQNIYALRKAFGSREAFSVLQLFWEKTDQLREMQEIVRQGMIKGMSVAEHMAYIIDRTLGQQLKILRQRIHNLNELIAEHMEGPAVAVVNLANKFMLLAQNIVKANRFLVRFAFTMTTLLGVSLVLAGAIRIFFGYIGLIRSSLFLLTKRSAEFAATLLKVSKIFGPLIAAAATFYAAYQANFLGIRDFIVSVIESLNQLWYRVVLVIRGFWELASSLTELRYGRISAETKWLLESLGLWDFVKDLFMIYVRVVNFLNSFYQGFKSTMEKIKAVVVPMLEVIRAVFTPIIKIVEVAAKALGLISDSVSQTDVEMLNLLGRALGAIIGPLLALKGIKIVGSSFMGAIEFFRSIERTRLERLNKVLLPLTTRNLSKDAKKALKELLKMKQEYDELLASGMDPQSQIMKALRASMRYRIQKAGLGQFFPDLIKQANKEANKEIAKMAGKPQKTSIFSRFLNVLFAIPKGFLNRINIWTKSITNATKYIQEHGLRKSLQTLFANLGKTKPVTAIKGFADSIRKSLKSAFTFIKNLPNTIVRGFKGIFNYVKSLTVAVFNLAKAILNFVRVILM